MTTTNQQTANEGVVVRTAYFVELHFNSGIVRVCNANMTFSWGGFSWIGLGTLGGISPIDMSAGVAAKSLILTLDVAQISTLALAIGAVEDYRGRDAYIYYCPLNEQFQLIDTPEICWTGIMDTMTTTVDAGGSAGQIALKCETSAYALKRRPVLRLNAAQQKQRYPTDTGFDYLNNLIAQPQTWLSRRFQSI